MLLNGDFLSQTVADIQKRGEFVSELVPASLSFDTAILAGQVAKSSMKMYQRDFKAYLNYAGTPEAAVKASTLARWRAHLSAHTVLSPNTINRMLSAVKSLMEEAEIQDYVPRGTAEDFKRIDGVKVVALRERLRPDARVRIESEDMRRLTDSPDISNPSGVRDRALLHTLASSGLRIHELASLTVQQIAHSAKGYQLSVMGKNDDKPRKAPLSVEAHSWIQKWLAIRPVQSEYIFTSYAGRGSRGTDKHMTPMSIWRVVKAYISQCELGNIKPHDFRRFVGTQLAKNNLREAQKALGHKSLDTTVKHYILDDLEAGITDNLY